MKRVIVAILVSIVAVPTLTAADLSKIPRQLKHEPKYQSKSPRYCLLAFGPKAEHRIWLVVDGNRLFVDRNGDGDLTGPSEMVVGKKQERAAKAMEFQIGELTTGNLTHRSVKLMIQPLAAFPKEAIEDAPTFIKNLYTKNPNAALYHLMAEVPMPGFTGDCKGGRVLRLAMMDGSNLLQFAESPGNAPIVYMGGSLQVRLMEATPLRLDNETDVNVFVGTPGLGGGAFALVAYEKLIPKTAHPVLEITWPAKSPDEPPIVEKYALTKRC